MAGEKMLADIRERLHKKSIHEVRLIARAVGVHSPTDGKKDFIIDKIMAIAACKEEPSPRSARGAPPKSNDFDELLVGDINECIRCIKATRAGADDYGTPQTGVSDSTERPCSGLLDRDARYFYIRINGCLAGKGDVYVADTVIRRFGLRTGDKIEGICHPAASGAALYGITSVNGFAPEAFARREFCELTPIYPQTRILLSSHGQDINARMADMFAPLAFGQRAVISMPSNLSKIPFVKRVAASPSFDTQTKAVIFLIGGYPEEVTDIRRSVPSADVFSTSLSATAEENAKAAELVTRYCKRLAECGKNAVLIVCGLSALAGNAMEILSSAINAEEGGSLTVVALVNAVGEYGSQNSAELLHAANMRLIITQNNAVDVVRSFTLGREYLQQESEIAAADKLRKTAAEENNISQIFQNTASNAEIVKTIKNGR